MARLFLLGSVLGVLFPLPLLATVLTPEQQANGTGMIPNPDFTVTYDGQIFPNNYYAGNISGEYYPAHASLSWYKYVSDGVTAVSFDLIGSSMSYGGGDTFGGSNDAELAVYDSNGHFVAGNQGVDLPANGDSNVLATGAPTITTDFHQPLDPTQAPYSYSDGSYLNVNAAGLPVLTFSNNTQPDPQWNPASPTYTAATTNSDGNPVLSSATADWDQYGILPAGTYFIAVAGYSTQFAGDPHDITTTPILNGTGDYASFNDTDYPYGFVDFSPMAGTYQLNVRLVGDMNGDGVVDTNDLNALIQNIQNLASTNGISPNGFFGGVWLGMPYNLAPYDLTGNSRIDKYDLLTFERLTGIYAPLTTQNMDSLSGDATMTIDSTRLVVANGGDFSGVLQDVVLPGVLQLNGGTLTLSGNNTFSGGTVINGGTLSVSTEANLGDVWGTITLNGGTLQVTGTAYTNTNRSFSIGTGGGTIAMTDPASNLTLTAPLTIAGTFTKSGPGTLAISQNFNTTAATVISGGTLLLENYPSTTAAITGQGNLTVLAGASLVSDGITVGGLTIGGSVQIRSNGASSGVSKVSALSVTGSLDLTNNTLILESDDISKPTAFAALQAEVAAGAGHATGIFSSTLPVNEALAVVDNGSFTTPLAMYNGVAVDSDSLIVTAALLGDANIDGTVDLNDLNTVLNHLGTASSSWTDGNFDNAATVDLNDLNDVLNNLGTHLAVGLPLEIVSGTNRTPEPASLGLLGAGALLLVRRRRG